MRDHTSDHMFGPGTQFGRRRSGATLSLVPDLDPVRDAGDGAVGVDAGVSARPGHRPARRRAPGPRPVRPAGAGGARQAPACRTVSRAPGRARPDQRPDQRPDGRERVLVRAPQRPSEPLAWRFRVRRAVAGVVAVLVTAAVVVGLGLLADAAAAARHAGPAAVERTVTDGSLTPAHEGAGQVLGVPVR